MPEGPSIVILKEALQGLVGKKVLEASGNAKIDIGSLAGRKIISLKSWGKHFLICMPEMTLRVHFLLFGSYSIGEQTKPNPRLALRVAGSSLYLYSCSVRFIGDPDKIYDWRTDVLNDQWDPRLARKKLKGIPGTLVCDALLDQDIFAGVGNIIKNEVLFRVRVHPESRVGALPSRKLGELIREARQYSFDFLAWKKAFELKKHWLAYNKKMCPRCHIPIVRVPSMGKMKRRTFYCDNCQVHYLL